MTDMSLGRRENPVDARDGLHRMAMVLPGVPTPLPLTKMWRGGLLRNNQGSVGACVGMAGANWMQCWPTYTRITNQTGFDLYNACKAVPDAWPGQEGTSSRFLMEVLRAQGRVARYLWGTTPAEVNEWVRGVGPVLVGIEWTRDMFNPDADGTLRPTGTVVGGHEVLVRGYDHRRDRYRIRNSWGSEWGDRGEAWIRAADLVHLLFERGGDAVGIVEARQQ